MPEFHRASQEPINTFQINQTNQFKEYFEANELFQGVKKLNNPQEYRFEVPQEGFEAVRLSLADHAYALVTVSEIAEFVIVVVNTPPISRIASRILCYSGVSESTTSSS